MEKELLLKYGGGAGQTILHPAVLVILLAMAVVLFIIPRRYVVSALIATALIIPLSQQVMAANLNFYILRILLFVAWLRVLIRQEMRPFGWNAIDTTIVSLAVASTITFTLVWGTWGAFVNRLGNAYDLIGLYFLSRCMLTEFEDIERIMKALVLISIPIALTMLIEYATERNVFAFLGLQELSGIREGRIRSQGPFANPILAGTFGATLLPLSMALWWLEGESARRWAALSAISATVIVWTSSSSGPILTFFAAIAGMLLWYRRDQMKEIRWGVVIVLISLHLVMKAPVWALLARVQVFDTSTGYHRYILMDNFIQRFGEWWLIGTKFTSDWAFGMWDITNQYVLSGINGGLITLALFIAVIAFSFQAIGRAVHSLEGTPRQKVVWGLGAALFAHAVAFFGISYFDQITAAWYALLGMVALVASLSAEGCLSPELSPAGRTEEKDGPSESTVPTTS